MPSEAEDFREFCARSSGLSAAIVDLAAGIDSIYSAEDYTEMTRVSKYIRSLG